MSSRNRKQIHKYQSLLVLKKSAVRNTIILCITKEETIFPIKILIRILIGYVQIWKKKRALELMKYSLWSNLEEEELDSFRLHLEMH